MIRISTAFIVLIVATSNANANAEFLFERAGGAAYYDWQQDITWLADANYAGTSGTDNQGSSTDGLMFWSNAHLWIDTLNASNHLGINTWRMPQLLDFGNDGTNQSQCLGYSYFDQGELTFLYFEILDGAGIKVDCQNNPQPYGLPNMGPFININQNDPDAYWYGQTHQYDPVLSWVLHMAYGGQHGDPKASLGPVWPVFDGDLLYNPGDPLPAVANIDVLPFDPESVIEPGTDRTLAVIVWGSATFDAGQIDPDSVRFAPGDETLATMELASPVVTTPFFALINNDEHMDMAAVFQNIETGIVCEDTEITIYGETHLLEPFAGTDSINTPECETNGGCHP